MTAVAEDSKILLRIKKQRHMTRCSSLEWSVKRPKEEKKNGKEKQCKAFDHTRAGNTLYLDRRAVIETDMTTLAYNNHVRKMIREGIDPKQIIKHDLRVMLDDIDSGKMTREEAHGKFMHFSRIILDIAAEEKKRIGGN